MINIHAAQILREEDLFIGYNIDIHYYYYAKDNWTYFQPSYIEGTDVN